jgi:hypothetical protein
MAPQHNVRWFETIGVDDVAERAAKARAIVFDAPRQRCCVELCRNLPSPICVDFHRADIAIKEPAY